MLKALLFDCGGVIVAPVTADWMLPPESLDILGVDFLDRHLDAYRRAKRAASPLLPDGLLMHTDQEEYRQLFFYYNQILRTDMGIRLSDEEIDRIAAAQAFGNDRYRFWDDVLPYFERWQARYALGIVSDAPPSLGRILRLRGYARHMGYMTLSCDLGVMKPDPRMYRSTLDALGVAPEEALYVDDLPDKLEGARALGVRCVQMRREMPAMFPAAPLWDGDRVTSFAELDALLP